MVRRELDGHRPERRLGESKDVGAAARRGQVGRGAAVDQQVGGVDARDRLREVHFDLGQGRKRRAGVRKLEQDVRRHVVNGPHQIGVHIEVGTGEIGVEGLDGDDVGAGAQDGGADVVGLNNRLARSDGSRGDGGRHVGHVEGAHQRPVDPNEVTVVDVDRERDIGQCRRVIHNESASHEDAQPVWRGGGASRNQRDGNRISVANRRRHGLAPAGRIQVSPPGRQIGRRGFIGAQAVGPRAAVADIGHRRRLCRGYHCPHETGAHNPDERHIHFARLIRNQTTTPARLLHNCDIRGGQMCSWSGLKRRGTHRLAAHYVRPRVDCKRRVAFGNASLKRGHYHLGEGERLRYASRSLWD